MLTDVCAFARHLLSPVVAAVLLLFAASAVHGEEAAPAAAGMADYQLGPGDLVRITVFGAPELTSETRVSQSGTIGFPLVGELAVTGRSARQVEAMLTAHLLQGGFLRHPQVSVHVLEYQSQKIAVMGHVTNPGQYTLRSAARVLDVLAQAGGLINDEAADVANLLRKDGSRTEIDLQQLFSGDATQNQTIAAGDTLFVPRASQFYIYGEVQRPGKYKLERGMTVSRAIAAGGGLTARGSERRVTIKRRDDRGEEIAVSARGDDPLHADDVLLVKEGWF